MYYSCTCVKRNGLQHDCRLTACGGEPACLVRPDPVCAPSQLARVRGLADPTSLLPHLKAENDRSPKQRAREGGGTSSGTGTGKRFVVCELKGIMPDVKVEAKEKKCCCPCAKASDKKDAAGKPPSGVDLPVLLMKLC